MFNYISFIIGSFVDAYYSDSCTNAYISSMTYCSLHVQNEQEHHESTPILDP